LLEKLNANFPNLFILLHILLQESVFVVYYLLLIELIRKVWKSVK